MLEVPALSVKLTLLLNVIGVDPLNVMVEEPSVMVLLLASVDVKAKEVTEKLAVSNDPLVKIIWLPVPLLNALPSVQPQSTPFTVTVEANATPLVVNVLPVVDPESVSAPVKVRVNPVAGSVILP